MKMGRYLIPALLLVMGVPAAGLCQSADGPSARSRRASYLSWQFKRLQADAKRLVELTGRLQAGLEDDSGAGMTEDVEGRVKALHQQAQDLFTAVEDARVNQLSFEVIQLAADIEVESKALRKEFEVITPMSRKKTFRDLANKIRKKTASVRRKMRRP